MYVRTGGIPVTYQCGFRNWSLGGLLLHLRESGMKFVGGYLIFSLQVIVHYRVVSDVCIGLLYGTGCAPSARWALFAAPRDMSDLSRFSLCSLSFLLKPWWMRLPWWRPRACALCLNPKQALELGWGLVLWVACWSPTWTPVGNSRVQRVAYPECTVFVREKASFSCSVLRTPYSADYLSWGDYGTRASFLHLKGNKRGIERFERREGQQLVSPALCTRKFISDIKSQ